MVKRFVSAITVSLVLVMAWVNVGTTYAQGTPTDTSPVNYVALGDSVAAGLGLPASAGTSGRTAQCGRSAEAYPYDIAAARNLTVMNIACSGATAGDLFTAQRVPGPNIPAQLPQAFANGTPELMTITAGANDMHWTAFLQKCMAATCGSSTDTALANAYLKALQLKLHYLFNDIAYRSNGTPPVVVVTGYYNPLSDQCAAADSRLTPAEIQWFASEVAGINTALERVSSHYSFVRFAPVNFSGHDLCSTDPWVQGLQDPAPIHPTAAGQAAIAEAVLSKL
jgi:lysophospholipase L1-like esterase